MGKKRERWLDWQLRVILFGDLLPPAPPICSSPRKVSNEAWGRRSQEGKSCSAIFSLFLSLSLSCLSAHGAQTLHFFEEGTCSFVYFV